MIVMIKLQLMTKSRLNIAGNCHSRLSSLLALHPARQWHDITNIVINISYKSHIISTIPLQAISWLGGVGSLLGTASGSA